MANLTDAFRGQLSTEVLTSLVNHLDNVSSGSQIDRVIWSPENPNADTGRLFTSPGIEGFKAAYELCRSIRKSGVPAVELYFDNQWSSVVDGLSNATTEIPTSAAEAVGFWDFTGIRMGGGFSSSAGVGGGGSGVGTSITFADNAFLRSNNDLFVHLAFGTLINDSDVSTPIQLAPGWGLCNSGHNMRLHGNTVATALPMIESPAGSPFNYLCSSANSFGGLGPQRAPADAPIWNINGIFCLLELNFSYVADDSFVDTAGGGFMRFQGPFRTGRQSEGQGVYPTLGEVGAGSDILHTNWMGNDLMQVGPTGFFTPPATLITAATTQIAHNNWLHFDATAGDLRVFAPQGNPQAGRKFTVSNAAGANNLLIETFGGTTTGNVRNVGGSDDVIDFPTVPPGMTATYRCDGGNGVGVGVGRWTRISYASAPSAAYTPTNVTPDRSYDADTVVITELADIVGTLIADMQAAGLIS